MRGIRKRNRATKVEVPIVGEQAIAVPEFFAVKTKTGYKLVNPLTKARSLSTRNGQKSIRLIRKPVDHLILMEHQTEPIALAQFSPADRETINTHFQVVGEHRGKEPADVPESQPFNNKERGRPEKLPKNIAINKERKKEKKKKKPEPEETKEETEQQEEKEQEPEDRPRRKKHQTEEARLEAVRKAKREWARRSRAKKAEGSGVGGTISAKELKLLHQSAYKKDKDKQVGDWVLDESISKPTAVVYVNQKTKEPIVIHRGTEGTVKDWANNLAYVAGFSKKTQRYKDSEAVQKQAEEKYGDTLTSGHSQGGIYSKLAKNKKGIIDVNPASMGEVATEGTTIRSATDPVSVLAGLTNVFKKSDKNVTTSAKSNPLEAHSLNILDELGDKQLGGRIGRGKKFSHKQLTDIILHKNKVIEDLEKNAYGGGMKDLKKNKILDNGIMPKMIDTMGCGVHHHHHYHMGGMGFEDMLRDAGKYVQPLADASMDRAMKEVRGKGIESLLRDAGKYVQPLADASMDRAMKEIRGSGFKKGSQEAKEHMARIRGMRKGKKMDSESSSDEETPKPKRSGRFVKGSQEAKDFMASIRRKK